jgi:hypothetical protein
MPQTATFPESWHRTVPEQTVQAPQLTQDTHTRTLTTTQRTRVSLAEKRVSEDSHLSRHPRELLPYKQRKRCTRK